MKLRRIAGHIVSNVGIQLINIATSLVIIWLTPFEEIGRYAIVIVVAGVLGLLGTLRLEWIIFNTTRDREALMTAQAGVFAAFLCAPLALTVSLGFQALGWLNFGKVDAGLLIVGALYVFTFAAQRVIFALHLARSSIGSNVRARLLHAVARLGASVALCGSLGLAEAIFLAEVAATLLLLPVVRQWDVFTGMFSRIRIKFAWLLRHHRTMLAAATPSAIIGSLSVNLVPTIMISAVGLEAGGIVYTAQRIAGVPVKFALTTFGEIWHKLVRRGDARAIFLGRSPRWIAAGMVMVFLAMLGLVTLVCLLVDRFLVDDPQGKVGVAVEAVRSYRIFIAATLATNLFNRVLVMRNAIHKKLVTDVLLLLAPLPMVALVPRLALDVFEAMEVLSILQGIALVFFGLLILRESLLWSRDPSKPKTAMR